MKLSAFATMLVAVFMLFMALGTARAGEGDFTCGKYVTVHRGTVKANTDVIVARPSRHRQIIRLPTQITDAKWHQITRNGRPCKEGE
jgi:hypothetical protein